MKLLIKTVALVVLTIVIVLTYISRADAGGPWSNQYCNIETETIKTIDQNGNLVNEETKEKRRQPKKKLQYPGVTLNLNTWGRP